MDVKQLDAIIKVLSEFRKEFIAMRDENERLRKKFEQLEKFFTPDPDSRRTKKPKTPSVNSANSAVQKIKRKRGPKLTAYKFVKLIKSTGKFMAVVKRRDCRFSKYGFETAEAAHLAAIDAIAAAGMGNGVSPVTPDEIEEAKIKEIGEPVVFYDCKGCGAGGEHWKVLLQCENDKPTKCRKCGGTSFEKRIQRQKLLNHTLN